MGIDIIEIERIREAIKKDSFVKGVFTAYEIEYCSKRAEPEQSFAGIYCAKEAVLKVTGEAATRGALISVMITHEQNGKPRASFMGKNYEISISHCKQYAVAIARMV